jgi:hypothetical protein
MANKPIGEPRVLGPPTIKTNNRRHHEIMTWLVAHPDRTLSDCARALGYTIPWICRVVNSDMFQAEMRQLQEAHRKRSIEQLEHRLYDTTHRVLTHINGKIDSGVVSETFVLGTTNTLLGALGYSSKAREAGEPQRHLHLHVDGEQLARAREKQREAYQSGYVPAKLADTEDDQGDTGSPAGDMESADLDEPEAWEGV